MGNRTTVHFRCDADPSSIIDAWASGNGYRLKETNGSERTYQKGTGFLLSLLFRRRPMILKVNEDQPGFWTLEAWIRVNIMQRLLKLFLVPSEMGIGSGGLHFGISRMIARKAVNKLLSELGQSPDAHIS